ncbi:MAG: DNA polymerase sliding clamp [Methanocellales archaeon]
MFKAVIEADILKDSIEAIATLVDEAKFKLSKDGISLRAVDPANVAMVSFSLSPQAFASYESTEGEIGIDLIKLGDILGMANKGDLVELELDEVAHKLKIKIGGLIYTLSLLDPSTIRKEPKVPNLELPARIVVDGSELRRAVKASEKIGDHMALGVKGDIFYMEAEGDTDKVRLEISRDKLISLTSAGDVRSLFSLDYLSDVSKAIAKAKEVTIYLGKDYPVKFDFEIANGNGSVSYLIAPRIETD